MYGRKAALEIERILFEDRHQRRSNAMQGAGGLMVDVFSPPSSFVKVSDINRPYVTS